MAPARRRVKCLDIYYLFLLRDVNGFRSVDRSLLVKIISPGFAERVFHHRRQIRHREHIGTDDSPPPSERWKKRVHVRRWSGNGVPGRNLTSYTGRVIFRKFRMANENNVPQSLLLAAVVVNCSP